MHFNNKVAFITGGASGIGFATGKALAESGAKIVLADINEGLLAEAEKAIRNNNPTAEVLTLKLDVRDRDAWQMAKQETTSAFGSVDILFNNAGIINNSGESIQSRQLVDQSFESFDQMIAINLTGVFNGIATFGAQLRDKGAGHIVSTASTQGLITCCGVGSYSAGKFAVVAMSECLHDELKPFGVGVSVLCPGVVATRLSETSGVVTGEASPTVMPAGYGMSPDHVATLVLDAISKKRLYIHTHGEYAKYVAARHERILADFADVAVSDMFDPNNPPAGTREWIESMNR